MNFLSPSRALSPGSTLSPKAPSPGYKYCFKPYLLARLDQEEQGETRNSRSVWSAPYPGAFPTLHDSLAARAVAIAAAAVVSLVAQAALAADFEIRSADPYGMVSWANAFTAGVCTVETAVTPGGPWIPQQNYFTTNEAGSAPVPISGGITFCRLLATDISTNTPWHYTNLLYSYGRLETIAGKGQYNGDRTSYWLPSYEGGWATNANLSRPHIAFGDPHGNVLIVDQGSCSVLKVTPEGRIYTYAGTHVAGFNGDGPAPATNLQMRLPNGGWMRSDGTLYVLDTENNKLRRIDTNQVMTTMFTTLSAMGDGRSLWVKSDESVVYFGSGSAVGANVTTLNKWTPPNNFTVVRSDFQNMGNIMGDERTGALFISDREAYRIYRLETNGALITIAGNGTASGSGGEGFPALESSLNLPRSVWFLPNGGFFVGEHDPGNRIWFIDPAGILHRWMNGSSAKNVRVGDGQWFYANPSLAKVSRVRSVVTDPVGNLIIVESNYGFVRRIRFERLTP